MNRNASIVGIVLCGLLLAMHFADIVDLGYFAYGLGFMLLGLGVSLFASRRSGSDIDG